MAASHLIQVLNSLYRGLHARSIERDVTPVAASSHQACPSFIASVSPPTALSLTWGLEEYVELLAGAVAQLS
jgi:hypothetical protein